MATNNANIHIETVKKITNEVINSIQNTTATVWVVSIFIFVILSFIGYAIYLSTLQSAHCSFFQKKYSDQSKLISINESDPNCRFLLRDYYIKTAYNCCSGGSYKNDFVTLCTLKSILGQGVRALDFEIYSLKDRPVVATSTVNSVKLKETFNHIDFSEVMNLLKYYAFTESTCQNARDPLILHLRCFSNNQEMYKNLAAIFKANNNMLLGKEYSYEYSTQDAKLNLGKVPLLELKNKIILVIDASNRSFMDCKELYEFVNMTSNSAIMRALHNYDIQYTPDLKELIEFNKQCMTMAMPDKGANPGNPSGALVRETGSQFIAMRFQKDDVYLEESNLFFDKAGYAFVLKPEKFRYFQKTIPAPPPPAKALSYEDRVIKSDYYTITI